MKSECLPCNRTVSDNNLDFATFLEADSLISVIAFTAGVPSGFLTKDLSVLFGGKIIHALGMTVFSSSQAKGAVILREILRGVVVASTAILSIRGALAGTALDKILELNKQSPSS